MDLAARVVLQDGADPVELTQLEAAFLDYLAERPGETVDRDLLLREVWGYAASVQSRAIDKSVHRLRTKLELDPAEPRHLIGVRGVGYRLDGARRYRPHLSLQEAAALLHQQAIQAGVDRSRLEADPGEGERIARLLHGHAEPLRLVAPRMAFQGVGEVEGGLLRAIGDADAPPERWLLALRACVDEEWSAIDPRDREVLGRLAGFAGTFSSEDALAVQVEGARGWALEALERAVARMLVWLEPTATGGRRMRLSPAFRARALQDLERRGERERVVAAGSVRMVEAAEGLARELARGDVARARALLAGKVQDLLALVAQIWERDPALAARALLVFCASEVVTQPAAVREWTERLLPRLQGEHPKLYAACLVQHGDALRLLGYPTEAAQSCVEALAISQDPVIRAEALVAMSSVGYWSGERVDESLRHLEDALSVLVGREEPRLEARLWLALAYQLARKGDYERALGYVRRGVVQFRAARDLELLGLALMHLANVHYWRAHFEDTLEAAEELRQVARELGSPYFELRSSLILFSALWELGRIEEATVHAERARVLAVQQDRKQPLILAHSACGHCAMALDLLDLARYHFQTCHRIAEEVGNQVLYRHAGGELGTLAYLRGALEEARELIDAYLESEKDVGQLQIRWFFLTLRAMLAFELRERALLGELILALEDALPSGQHPELSHLVESLALCRVLLARWSDPPEAQAARLREHADRVGKGRGYEPRTLATFARRAAERLERAAGEGRERATGATSYRSSA